METAKQAHKELLRAAERTTTITNLSVRITKGCKSLGIPKGGMATVLTVTPISAQCGQLDRVTILVNGKTYSFVRLYVEKHRKHVLYSRTSAIAPILVCNTV
jgi:hypothetical protein